METQNIFDSESLIDERLSSTNTQHTKVEEKKENKHSSHYGPENLL